MLTQPTTSLGVSSTTSFVQVSPTTTPQLQPEQLSTTTPLSEGGIILLPNNGAQVTPVGPVKLKRKKVGKVSPSDSKEKGARKPRKRKIKSDPNPEIVQLGTDNPQPSSQLPNNNINLECSQPKRSRKQQIQPLREDEITPIPVNTDNNIKKRKRRSKKEIDANAPKTKKVSTKSAKKTVTTKSSSTVVSKKSKIVLNRSEIIISKPTFTVIPDTSRNLSAIAPFQCFIAAEAHNEPGEIKELLKYTRLCKAEGKTVKNKFSNNCLNTPHFFPITDIWKSGEPFTRILKFSSLERYTRGVQWKNSVSVFRFHGKIYEKQVRDLDFRLPKSYPRHTLVIKHPVFHFFSRNSLFLRFVILKKYTVKKNFIVIPICKVIKLKRSTDLKNVEIFVEEEEFTGTVSDVNAMSQRDFQPVIQTSTGGLIPLLANRTTTLPQPVQYQIQPEQNQHFSYVRYQYQTASELVPAEESYVNANNNLGINEVNYQIFEETPTNEYCRTTYLREEAGPQPQQQQVVILPAGILQQEQQNHVIIQPESSHTESTYTIQNNYPVVHQQHQQQPVIQQPTIQHIQLQSANQVHQPKVVDESPQSAYKTIFFPGESTPVRVRLEPQLDRQQIHLVYPPNHFQTGQAQQHQTVVLQPQQLQSQPLTLPDQGPQQVTYPQLSQIQQFVRQVQLSTTAGEGGQQTVIVRRQPQNVLEAKTLTPQQTVQLTQQLQQQRQIQQLQQQQHQYFVEPQPYQQVNQTQQHGPQLVATSHIQQLQTQAPPPKNQVQVITNTHTPDQPQSEILHQHQQTYQLQVGQQQKQVQTYPPQKHQPVQNKVILTSKQLVKTVVQQASSQSQPIVGQPVPSNTSTVPVSVCHSQAPQFQQLTSAQQSVPPTLPSLKQKTARAKVKSPKKGKTNLADLPPPPKPLGTSPPLPSVKPSGPSPASLVRINTVSPCSSEGNSAAVKSLLIPSPSPGSSSSSPTKTIVILNSVKPIQSSQIASSDSNPITTRPTSKPGCLAVCPHCGSCSPNLAQCTRCRIVFPDNVKLLNDVWSIGKNEAAILITPQPVTTTTTPNSSNIKADNTNKPTTSNPKKPGEKTHKKIVLIQKPALIDSPSNNNNDKGVVKSGIVQVQIQPDGGSTVFIDNRVSTSVIKKNQNANPAPRKRAPPRKKQQECITLSSDEEESEPTKPNETKPEEPISTENTTGPRPAILKISKSSSNSHPPVSKPDPVKLEVTSDVQGESKDDIMKRKATVPGGTAIKINLNLSEPVAKVDESLVDPSEILKQIESQKTDKPGRFKYVTVDSRSVRVGSYKVTNSDTGFPISIQLTELGILFKLPHSNLRHKVVSVCIPLKSIIEAKISNQARLSVIFITTGPKYANWIRETLGLDGSAGDDKTNYYCPLEGGNSQRQITILGDGSFPPADYGLMKDMYKDVLIEIDNAAANSLLLQFTSDSYKGLWRTKGNSTESSSASSDTSPGVPMIVSTRSIRPEEAPMTSAMVKGDQEKSGEEVAPQPRISGGEVQTKSSSTSVITGGPGVVTTSGNVDPGRTILFYEGVNNVKVPVAPQDIRCLGYEQFLNDQIIDFWLSVINTEILSDRDRKRTFIFDSFFYSKLTEKIKKRGADEATMTASERRHARVKKRTKNVDIFEKDFLIVPINENYHWFLAIICFPGLQGFHDYETLAPLPDYKGTPRPRQTKASARASQKPIVYNQPKNQSTAAYSNRDEAPEDPDEAFISNSPENEETDKAQRHNDTEAKNKEKDNTTSNNKPASSQIRVKHPCILVFDSLAGEARGRIYSTLRDYLRIEYKTKKNEDREFNKDTMPGSMPKVPQQPNFSDCGLFMLQYVESFFSIPLESFEITQINLKNWFPSSIAENKRREIYNFIMKRTSEKCPENVSRIPEVNFEAGPNDLNDDDLHDHSLIGSDEAFDDEDESDGSLFEEVVAKRRKTSTPDGKIKVQTSSPATPSPNKTSTQTYVVVKRE